MANENIDHMRYASFEILPGISVYSWARFAIFDWIVGVTISLILLIAEFIVAALAPSFDIWPINYVLMVIAFLVMILFIIAFYGMRIKSVKELAAGYSTARDAPPGVILVDPASRRIIRTSEEAKLSAREMRLRLRSVRIMGKEQSDSSIS